MSLTVTMVSSVVETPYTVLWDGESAFNVPWELTQEIGVIGFSVLGISSSTQSYQRGLTQSSVGLLTVVTPGINVGDPPVEPTPSAYERVLAMIQSLPEVENRAEAVINDLDNAFRGVAQYLPVGMGNVVTAELDGTDSELVSVADAFKNGKLLGAKVYGKSTQESTTGAQLLNVNRTLVNRSGVNFTPNADGSCTLNGTCTKTDFFGITNDTATLLPEGDYIISCDDSSLKFRSQASGGVTSKTFHTDGTYSMQSCVQLIVENGLTYNTTFHVMLNSGSTALPWEPYTGGIASPNPDYPQEIKSVAEGDLKLTGKCIWGGEQMADDIVAAVGNTSYAWKGEDADGKYVALRAGTILSRKTLFKIPANVPLIRILICAKRSNTSPATNMVVRYSDDSNTPIYISDASTITAETVYTKITSSVAGREPLYIQSGNSGGTAYIYYEKSGVFEDNLTVDSFTPYSSDLLHFLPDDIEPLRSLPDGTRDILTIDANGNGVIERNVHRHLLDKNGVFVFASNVYQISTSASQFSNYRPKGSYNVISNLFSRATSFAILSAYPYAIGKTDTSFAFRVEGLTSKAEYDSYFASLGDIYIDYKIDTITEIIPASRMPKVPSQYLHAWLEAKDQNGEEIVTNYSIYYEKSIGALLSQIEQALDAAGYPITDYEPEDAMSVAPELSNDANPVTDAQMAAAVTYGFTLN